MEPITFDEVRCILNALSNLGNLSKENKANVAKITSWANNIHEECEEYKRNSVTKPSYTAIVKSRPPPAKVNEKTLVIKARQNCDPKTVANQVFEGVNIIRKTTPNIKINKIIRSKSGAIIKAPMETNIDEMISMFKEQDKLAKIATVYKPKFLDPLIILKNINKEQDVTKIPKDLCNINEQFAGLDSQIKVLFASKSNGPAHDVYLRVSPKVFQAFVNSKHIFLDYESIRWLKNVHVRQCQNCMCFNPDHQSKNCPNQQMCKLCGKTGPHKCDQIQKCGNCMNHQFHSKHSGHKPNSTECPLYEAQHK